MKDDTISRQAAIEGTKKIPDLTVYAFCSFIDMLTNMPSAQPETGKWVRNFDGNEWYWFCSNCKEEWYEEDLLMGGNDFPNFCPNCGADMR